jgi:hypothetical protein
MSSGFVFVAKQIPIYCDMCYDLLHWFNDELWITNQGEINDEELRWSESSMKMYSAYSGQICLKCRDLSRPIKQMYR